ncbi:DUF3040 domain-containing protein [Gordonia jinhuaensis]|uniref:DUF3040 domain-containing protein n=1 Tax=Gordonia jinhuaensis TaxID=1517702 RepID=A0A916SW79_9ACTN|nr:DUF3040 domain-containing protein [Gordonia jinhuaensis]GGB19199.1 hypothetical protein GCM10011489_04130 [Gordonia jinhuaensis]
MPLSEHEQRMLEEIENALYAEDPKFASTVRGRRFGGSTARRRIQAAVVFVIGLALLIGGLLVNVRIGDFPILSLVGFVVMFGAGLMALWGLGGPKAGSGHGSGGGSGESTSSAPKRGKGRRFSERMEERFNRRFDQDR